MQSHWDSARFSEALARVRSKTGLSQKALADLGHVNPSLLSRWLSGASRPSFGNLETFIGSLRRERPDLDDLMPELIAAAGYGSLGEVPPDERPELVRAHWSDAAVREIWGLQKTPRDVKLGAIADLVGADDDASGSLPAGERAGRAS